MQRTNCFPRPRKLGIKPFCTGDSIGEKYLGQTITYLLSNGRTFTERGGYFESGEFVGTERGGKRYSVVRLSNA